MSWLQTLKNKTKSKQSLASVESADDGGSNSSVHRPGSSTSISAPLDGHSHGLGENVKKVSPQMLPVSVKRSEPNVSAVSTPSLAAAAPPATTVTTDAAKHGALNIKLKAIYPTQAQSPSDVPRSKPHRSGVLHLRAIEGRSISIPSSVLSVISADKNPLVRQASTNQTYLHYNPYLVASYDRNEIVINSMQGTLAAPVWRHKATFDLTHDADATFAVYIRTAAHDPTTAAGGHGALAPVAATTTTAASTSTAVGAQSAHSPTARSSVRSGVCSTDVLLGSFTLDYGTIQSTASGAQTLDQWFTLTHPSSSSATGQIHLQISVKQTKQTISIDDFDLLTVVGKGSFGKVMQVKKKDTGRVYAMKILKKSHLVSRDEVSHTISERNVLRQLQHPFIVNLKFAFQNEHKLYLVLPFVNGGELFKHLSNEGRFSEERARFYTAELVTALECLHNYDIIYRDLKPENILLDYSGHIALCDFGLCKLDMGDGARTNTFCGTPEYLAGEVLIGNGYTKAVDWWTLGILLYEMLTGLPPFYDENVNEMYRKILYAPLTYPGEVSPQAQSLLNGLLERNAERRLGANDIKAHPFFASIDWRLLVARKITPPFKPTVENSLDTSNFDEEFTREVACDSVVEESVLSQTLQGQFRGFTYIPGSELTGTMNNSSPMTPFAKDK